MIQVRSQFLLFSLNSAAFWVVFISCGVLAAITPIIGELTTLLLLPSYLFVFGTFLLAAVTNPKVIGIAVFRLFPLVLLFFVALLSARWSIEPAQSRLDAVRLLVHCASAASVAMWFGSKGALKLLAAALAVGAMLSILVVPFPTISIGYEGDFRGVFQQKNILGFCCSVALIIYSHELLYIRKSIWNMGAVVACASCIALSNSVTSAVICGVALSSMVVFKIIENISGRITVAGMLAVLVLVCGSGLLSQIFQDDILTFLGRDTTLTGRTELWDVGRELIAREPVLGYGYQVLSAPFGWLAEDMITNVGEYALQFHNSWINIQFQLGYAGLVLNVFCFAFVFYLAIQEVWRRGDSSFAVLLFALGTSFAMQSLSESTFGGPRSVQTFLLALVFTHRAHLIAGGVAPYAQRTTSSMRPARRLVNSD